MKGGVVMRTGACMGKLVSVAALGVLLAGCGGGLLPGGGLETANTAGSGGSALGNLMQFGTTSPPPAAVIAEEERECPPVSITAGGAALRLGAADSQSVRSQITVTDVARDCTNAAGGGVTVRVGAEGRVLVGPAGSAGPINATLRIEVKRGDQVIASRNARVGATVPAGQGQATWVHVEDGILVPGSVLASSGDIDVFVTLNPGATQTARRRR